MPNANQTLPNAQPKMSASHTEQQKQRKPNDISGIAVHAHFKIFDPVSKQVHVEGRA